MRRELASSGPSARGVAQSNHKKRDAHKTAGQTPDCFLVAPKASAGAGAIDPHDLAGETFISVSQTAPVLRVVIDDYLKRLNLAIKPDHEVDNLAMAMSLAASTRGVAFLPAYARNFLPWSVISRPIKGDAPTIDLVIGYNRANTSPTLKLFLSRLDELIARVSKRVSDEPHSGHTKRPETGSGGWAKPA